MSQPAIDQLPSRFSVRSCIGQGATGTVYDAWDAERQIRVALKLLTRVTPGGIYRFKNEFRALADVDHPNLVTLYELGSLGHHWFLTMDLVEGVDFLEWVREGANPYAADTVEWTPYGDEWLESGTHHASPGRVLRPVTSTSRIRESLDQLVTGLAVLHDAGFLHRDVKPSNVLVRPDQRVVILDFGLVRDQEDIQQTLEERVVGTPAYMAPEQAAGAGASAASDWYAVGVMLYEALTGLLPFEGTVLQVLSSKQLREPADPRALLEGLPDDLAELAVLLLRRDPEQRPDAAEIRARLRGEASTAVKATVSSRRSAPFVGRERQLTALGGLFDVCRRGSPAVVQVHGVSGAGKTSLVRHFLETVRNRGDAVVLAGRCYERESVPYKALDSVIDALSRHLRQLSEAEAAALLPRDVHALARVFPVLRRVHVIDRVPLRKLQDPQELRNRAFAALKEMLGRMADRRPLVMFIDDLQWGDVDSAALLREILRPPDAPALLLIMTYRTEEQRTTPMLQLFGQLQTDEETIVQRELMVDRLSEEEARLLATAMLHDEAAPDSASRASEAALDELSAAIARESEGIPLFVGELVRHAHEQRASEDASQVRLTAALRDRIERLAAPARALLEAVCIAAGPISPASAVRAAGLKTEAPKALAALRAAHLVRTGWSRGAEAVESYHDRIRDSVLAALSVERRQHLHARLGQALERSGDADPEQLAAHFEGSGDRDKARRYVIDAAERAATTLAFERAAWLYRHALSLQDDGAPDRADIDRALGEALAGAGRSAEAADAYLRAADARQGNEALELRRRAAEHLLRSGHIERGLNETKEVLSAVGMSFPRTPKRALLSAAWHRGKLRMRGMGFTERSADDVAPEVLRRLDTCWSAALGLTMVDPVRGTDFQARFALRALRTGEPHRIARALAMEIAHLSQPGPSREPRVRQVYEMARQLAERVGDPYVQALVHSTWGVSQYFFARWRAARDHTLEAEQIWREHCTNTAWELASTLRFHAAALYFTGALDEIARRVPAALADAERRGDLYASESARGGFSVLAWLVPDRPDEAEIALHDSLQRWSERSFQLQHYLILQALTCVGLYRNDAEQAWQHLGRWWPVAQSSLLPRVQMARVTLRERRAACGLISSRGEDAEQRLRIVEGDLRHLEREDLPSARATAQLLRAALCVRRGEPERALEFLEGAERSFEAHEMPLHVAAARHARGLLVGGETGKQLVDEARDFVGRQGARKPGDVLRIVAPGFERP